MFCVSALLQYQYGRIIQPKWNYMWINCLCNILCSSNLLEWNFQTSATGAIQTEMTPLHELYMFSYFDMQYQTIRVTLISKYVFESAMEKHFTSVLRFPALVEVSHVSVTVIEVISRPGMLVWVDCCVGLMFCVFFVVCTTSTSISPEGNTQDTCNKSNYN